MFLKQLEIVGFKSFAEKTAIEFVPGITAVVGPNGSGKSNIIDAIRWVLGEQSARSLRGGKMEDVIFSGSDSRKRLNYAEVSLVLNNEDGALPVEFNEVSVTRRVYRSGDSDFLINRKSCRLKDIIDLFMDSGLGREAFSIISQGKVDEILNSKPEERRSIFEEAAGVLKYKTRKKKAESKLQETTENLNRVSDIINELEGQLEPLQIQASIAKDYLDKKSELENLEVALIVHDIESIHQLWEKSKQEFERLQSTVRDDSIQVAELESGLKTDRGALHSLELRHSELQAALLTLTEELEKLEGRREVLRERQKNAVQNTEQLQKSIAEAGEKMSALRQELEEKRTGILAKEQEAASLAEELLLKRQQIELLDGTLEETIESLKGDYIDLLNEQASSKNELQYMEQQLQLLGQRRGRLDEENKKFLDQRQEAEDEYSSLSEQFKGLEDALNQQLRQFQTSQQELAEKRQELEKQEAILYQAYHFIQQTKSRKESLEALEEDYSGFFQGVREVLKARDSELEGIEGAIAELVQVPKKYEVAIDTALGGSLQNIVVKTEEHGRKAIEFLKRNRLGRATFLPLNIVKPKFLPSDQKHKLSDQEAFVGVASELIHYKPEHKAAIESLLGNTVIASDLKGASRLAALAGHRLRIVTLEGEIINPGGSMTGGATRQTGSSLLSRKNELEELKGKLEDMEKKTAILEETVKRLKTDVAEKSAGLEHIREQGEELRSKVNETQSLVKQAEIVKKNINDRLSLYDIEEKELKSESATIESRIAELTAILEESGEKINGLNEKISTLTTRRDLERKSRETLGNETSELAAKSAVANEQLAAQKQELSRISKELKEAEKRHSSLQADREWLDQQLNGHHTTEEELAVEAEEKAAKKAEAVETISVLQNERESLREKVEQKDAEVRERKRQNQGLLRAMNDTEVKMNRYEVELDSRLERLREEYELTFEGAKSKYTLPMDAEVAREKVKLIKRGITELGAVNLGAIEEFERVNERYSFLSEQQEDLLHAKTTLFSIMDEMDDEMKKRFSYTFHAIQNEFEGVFQALFGGGRAQLKLTDEQDLLTTGVDIVAQPPGKKLQNLSLLSGGERALTAIALLFSILKVRPVPFCILDEVEAALDDANVQRFSDYLRMFSQETQFIVITHRQGTMQGADVLYGVTMQESGVSKLVSVKMEEEKALIEM